MVTLEVAVSAWFPARALFASRMNAAKFRYESPGRVAPPGGIVDCMKVISSPAVASPHWARKLAPANCGPSFPLRSGEWQEAQLVW